MTVSDVSGVAGRLAAILPWVARAGWIALPLGAGAIGDAADDRTDGVAWTVAIAGWGVFGVVLVALLVPSVWSLTIARVLGPLALVATPLAAVFGAEAVDVALLGLPALVANAGIFSPEFGRFMVQGSAYGDEQRFPLRAPAAPGIAAVVSWVLWAALVIAAVLLPASGTLAIGIPLAVVALAASVLLLPRWNRMSRRWFVLVPAGVVVHDPLVLADTVMVPTGQVRGSTLARADTEAADLTGPASGHAVEVTTSESAKTVFAPTPSQPGGRAIHMTAFLVAPSRPGAMLAAARARGLPVG